MSVVRRPSIWSDIATAGEAFIIRSGSLRSVFSKKRTAGVFYVCLHNTHVEIIVNEDVCVLVLEMKQEHLHGDIHISNFVSLKI